MRRRALLSWGLVAAIFCVPIDASAHPLVDEARRLVDAADFAAAGQAFARAEAATDLSRDDLVALLEGRALLHHALSDTAALEADLARLAALEPDHAFGPRMPPELGETFLRVRTRSPGVLRLELAIRPVPSGVAAHATAINDPGGLVRAVEVHGRVAGGPWRIAADELVVTGAPGAGIELWAAARGPGDVVVAERGSSEHPIAAVVPGAAAPEVGHAPDGGEQGRRIPTHTPRTSSGRGWLIGGIVAVAVAALVTGGVLLYAVRSDETVVEAPELQGR